MRSRDYAYEALAEVTSADMNEGRGPLNAALKSIREQSEIEDSYLLADEIHARAKLYRQVFPEAALTPNALAKHWLRVFEEAQRTQGTNRAAETECATCGGDRFVLVSTRPPEIEQYAACPDCNGRADTSFRRFDGSYAKALDPAAVREKMRQ